MRHKNEKGFALVLSIVLLLVMSLMGGALIVISSGDHQSNNSSDQYQQTFYVAETALLEGQKSLINRMMGPWVSGDSLTGPGPGASPEDIEAYGAYTAELAASAVGGIARDVDKRDLPRNLIAPIETPCFNSFRNIIRDRENLPIIPNPGIRIIFNGLQLEPPTSSLLDYDISENSVISICFRTRC